MDGKELRDFYLTHVGSNKTDNMAQSDSEGSRRSSIQESISSSTNNTEDAERTVLILEKSLQDSEKRVSQRDSYLKETILENAKLMSQLQTRLFEMEQENLELKGQMEELEMENILLVERVTALSADDYTEVASTAVDFDYTDKHDQSIDVKSSLKDVGTSTTPSDDDSVYSDEAKMLVKIIDKMHERVNVPGKSIVLLWLGTVCMFSYFSKYEALTFVSGATFGVIGLL